MGSVKRKSSQRKKNYQEPLRLRFLYFIPREYDVKVPFPLMLRVSRSTFSGSTSCGTLAAYEVKVESQKHVEEKKPTTFGAFSS